MPTKVHQERASASPWHHRHSCPEGTKGRRGRRDALPSPCGGRHGCGEQTEATCVVRRGNVEAAMLNVPSALSCAITCTVLLPGVPFAPTAPRCARRSGAAGARTTPRLRPRTASSTSSTSPSTAAPGSPDERGHKVGSGLPGRDAARRSPDQQSRHPAAHRMRHRDLDAGLEDALRPPALP